MNVNNYNSSEWLFPSERTSRLFLCYSHLKVFTYLKKLQIFPSVFITKIRTLELFIANITTDDPSYSKSWKCIFFCSIRSQFIKITNFKTYVLLRRLVHSISRFTKHCSNSTALVVM